MIVSATLALAALIAQAPQPPSFRAGAQVVQVDVRVMDRDGRFVEDLGPDDFQLLEDGVAQHVDSVTLVGQGITDGSRGGRGARGDSTHASLDPAGVSTPGPRVPAIWVFLFDTTHLSGTSLQRTRAAALKFINEKWVDGDFGGVLAGGRLSNNRFTRDPRELRAAVSGVTSADDMRSMDADMREWPRLQDAYEAFRIADGDRDTLNAVLIRACSDEPDRCTLAPPDMEVQSKVQQVVTRFRAASRQTLDEVDTLSKGLARLPGPKTVVFFSEGFPLYDDFALLHGSAGQAARAGARFYAVDARGTSRGAGVDVEQGVVDSTIASGSKVNIDEDGPNSLAVETGGFAVFHESDFGRALDRIQRDASRFYLLSYAPTRGTLDGRYHAIAVSVTRPGLTVRARKGYLALATAKLIALPTVDAAAASPIPGVPAVAPAAPPALANLVALLPPASEIEGGSVPSVVPWSRPDAAVRRAAAETAALARLTPAGDGSSSRTSPSAARGWAAYQRGDVDTAAAELDAAANTPGAPPWVLYALGLSRFAQTRYGDATQAWERVRTAAPAFKDVYFHLADAYAFERKEEKAITVLDAARTQWPSDPDVLNALGVMHVRRGALDAGIDAFNRAVEAAPADSIAFFNLGRAYELRMLKSRRVNPITHQPFGGEEDARRAKDYYERHIAMNGPYAEQAKQAINAFAWK